MMDLRRAKHAARGAALAALSVVTAAVLMGAASPAGASPSPITIAYVTSLTGQAASQFQGSQAGFLARIALQNAEGGVDGHKIVPQVVDDQTNPSSNTTAVQLAVQNHDAGIVAVSPVFFGGAKYTIPSDMPVTGSYLDGPEWGTQKNLFAVDNGSVDLKYPVNTGFGAFIKQHGGTVLGSYGYSISPFSVRAAIGGAKSFELAGGKVGELDTALPFGTTNFTSVALLAKQKGVNALYGSLDDNSNYALTEAAKQAGIHLKVVVFPTGYEPGIIHSPVWSVVQGGYFASLFRPFALPNAGTRQMQAALEKYQHYSSSQFPTFTAYESWLGADLLIKGLQKAGPTASHAAVVKAIRSTSSYNGNGLLPINLDYSTIFGHDPAQLCLWYMKAAPSGFVPVSSNPICGHDVKGSTTVPSS